MFHKPNKLGYVNWKVMRGGTWAYINQVHSHLQNTAVHKGTGVQQIVIHNNKVLVITDQGERMEFDHVIVTCGARDARMLMPNTPSPRHFRSVRLLQSHASYPQRPGLMPTNRKNWSVVNVMHKGQHADATIWHGSRTGANIFYSYTSPGDDPQHVHHVSEWWLPSETPEFFRAQKALEEVQGMDNIWFAGDYTRDTGSHEDAIVSALRIALKLSPNSTRVTGLSKGLETVIAKVGL